MPELHVATTDVVILLAYVVLTRALFGWWLARKTEEKGAETYFLAGRVIPWPVIGLSFYVANMSGGSFIGLPGAGYNDGIAVYSYEWVPALVLIAFAFVFLPLFLDRKLYTSSGFLEARYGRRTRLAFSAFMLITSIVVDATASLYAGAKIIQTLAPDFPSWMAVAAAAVIAGVYISVGGLGAVVINDALQAVLIFLGGALTLWLAWSEIPSWDAVRQAAPEGALELFQPATDEVLPWPGILSGVLVLSVYFWCMNQFVIQRALGARSLEDGRKGALFAGFLKLPNLFILILPGVMATAIYPDLKDPDLVFPTLVFDLLPVGLRGLMLAVLAAAILSSLEAILNASSTLVTMDFVKTRRPDISDRELTRIGRMATLAVMVLAVLWAPVVTSFPSLWQYLQSILSYLVPPVVAVFLLGVFWPRANESGALLALAVMVPLGAFGWLAVEVLEMFRLQFLYASGIQLVLAAGLVAAGSLAAARPPAEALEGTVFDRGRLARERERLAEARREGRRPFRLAGALAATALALVLWWW